MDPETSKSDDKSRAQTPNTASVRMVGICGSLVRGGATQKVVSRALSGASEYGVTTQLIDLRDYELVFCGQVAEEDYPQDVFRLRQEISEAQGIILGTPEYYGSLSGVLKNALDLMGPDQFEGKVVGLVGVAGGHTGAINSLNTMRTIGRNLHSWVVPQEVSVADAGKMFDEDGSLKDPALDQRLRDLGHVVARLSILQQRIRQDEFIQVWEGLPRW
jgi:NAD(P)H-dependent FMN reductase